MAEYIEREAFREVLRKSHKAHAKNCREEVLLDRDIRLLNEQPTADVVEVKRGRWKFHNDGSGTCDQCHFTQKHIYDDDGWQNFCGVCGADMRERRDSTIPDLDIENCNPETKKLYFDVMQSLGLMDGGDNHESK